MMTVAEIESATAEQLIEGFLPLAEAAAEIFGDGTEDDLADAVLGLVKAARTYDPTKGPFSVWASWYVKQSVVRGLRKRIDHISISEAKRREMGALSSAAIDLEAKGCRPNSAALSRATGIPAEKIEKLLKGPVARASGSELNLENMAKEHTTSAESVLQVDDIIHQLEIEFECDVPEDLVEEIRFWCRYDGGDKKLSEIRRKVHRLRNAKVAA